MKKFLFNVFSSSLLFAISGLLAFAFLVGAWSAATSKTFDLYIPDLTAVQILAVYYATSVFFWGLPVALWEITPQLAEHLAKRIKARQQRHDS